MKCKRRVYKDDKGTEVVRIDFKNNGDIFKCKIYQLEYPNLVDEFECNSQDEMQDKAIEISRKWGYNIPG